MQKRGRTTDRKRERRTDRQTGACLHGHESNAALGPAVAGYGNNGAGCKAMCVCVHVCVLLSLWRLGQWASGVWKDRGIIGQAKERQTWDWS